MSGGEAPREQLEREHEQLFHELRAVIPGAEVLFAFLLTIAFGQRFQELGDRQRAIFYATFVCSALSLVLLLAPTSFHRVRWRRKDKNAMLRLANVEVLTAMALISLAVAGVVYLVTDVVVGATAATTVAAGVWVVIAVVWWCVPLARFRSDGDTDR